MFHLPLRKTSLTLILALFALALSVVGGLAGGGPKGKDPRNSPKRPAGTAAEAKKAAGPESPQGQSQEKPMVHNLKIQSKGIDIPYPDGWSTAQQGNVYKLIRVPADKLQGLTRAALNRTAQLQIFTEKRKDHAEAVQRLSEIALEQKVPVTYLSIGGWPALERSFVAPREQPGENKEDVPGSANVLRLTTAIAVGATLVRIEGRLDPDSPPSIVNEAHAIRRGLSFANSGAPTTTEKELKDLRQKQTATPDESTAPAEVSSETRDTAYSSADLAGAVTRVGINPGRDSELEIAVSGDGRNIVIGSNSLYFFSTNGGQTFGTSNISVSNDPSLAFGPSGNFYAANISTPSTRIDRSTDNGANFSFRGNAFTCPAMGPFVCGAAFPDQEHIAADRFNAAPGGDQLYSAWRQLNGNVGIVCSADGGANWTATPDQQPGDLPRVGVGQDGTVYMVWLSGGNLMLARYRSCENDSANMANNLLGTATIATGLNPVACPIPGIDRCNGRNTLASPTIAVDDTNASHVYVAYATNTAPGGGTCTNQNTCNENVVVRDSLDGGVTWPGNSPGVTRVVTVNNGVVARRFMPWLGVVGGVAHVSWYDRRAQIVGNNDLTDFYRASASLNALGNLQVGTEVKINAAGTTDAQCAAGQTGANSWPGGTDDTTDSESCSAQPQLAGRCGTVTPCCANTDSGQPCDFSSGPACPAGETCRVTRGSPKYGDYNGSAAVAGRFYTVWASAVSPPGVTPATTDIDTFFSSTVVCCVPQIQVPGDVSFADTCVNSTSNATLNVCNSGKEDLEVTSITSNNAQFSVTTPSSGYPVVISPDFCFPFQAQFSPTSTGAKTANLTVNTNDPVNPTTVIQANGTASQQNIATTIADTGDFGQVCVGSYKDLDLTISNTGGCDLSITNITSSSGQFKTAQTQNFPLTIQGGTSIHVPIRFEPTSLGAKSANITISSNDPDTPSKVVAVSGHADPGDINVTGSGDFGDVCAGIQAEKTISVCNTGACDLHVASATIDCADFTIINNPFPATVSHDFCMPLTIRFTPTSVGPKMCSLTITSDDPDENPVVVQLKGNTPLASIDVNPDQGFLPEVIQSIGSCSTRQPFPILNKGTCPLTITNIQVGPGADSGDFGLWALPSFPINLQPGHTVGDGALQTIFAPTAIDRDRIGNLSVTYVTDPFMNLTTTVNRTLCGEGVRTGARVLVTAGGVPVSLVEKLQIQRINGNRNRPILDTVDNAMNLPLVSVTPTAPCNAFQYHREYGTVSNPIQLLPGSYQVTATAVVGKKRKTVTVGFDVSTCDFNPTIVINLQ